MKTAGLALSLCLTLSLVAVAGETAPKPLTVTYVGNTGYLIECDGHKVAIDALLGGKESEYYDIPSDSVVALMVAARPPFDGIDVIAVTHWHHDHFTAEIVAAYLALDTGCVLLCSQQVADRLSRTPTYATIRDQIRIVDAPVDSVTSFNMRGIVVKVLSSTHGSFFDADSTGKTVDLHKDVQHLEFLFTMAGRAFLHSGDAPLQDMEKYRLLELGKDSIDIAFVKRWGCYNPMSFGEKLVRERMLPRRVFFTHVPPKEMVFLSTHADCDSYRQVTIPANSLQSWIIP